VTKDNIQLIPVNVVKSREKADGGFTLQMVLESYRGIESEKHMDLTHQLIIH